MHQLIAVIFLNHIPCGFNLVINHKNFIKTDNRAENRKAGQGGDDSLGNHMALMIDCFDNGHDFIFHFH